MARRAVLVPVTVFAVVLLAVLALQLGGGSSRPGALPPLDLSRGAGGTRSAAGETDSTLGAPAAMPFGPVTYKWVNEPGDQPTEGRAYRLPSGTPDHDRVLALARALGLTGDVTRTAEGWEVRNGDKALVVAAYSGLPWRYSPDMGKPAIACDTPVASDDGNTSSSDDEKAAQIRCVEGSGPSSGSGSSGSGGAAVPGPTGSGATEPDREPACPPDAADCMKPEPAPAPTSSGSTDPGVPPDGSGGTSSSTGTAIACPAVACAPGVKCDPPPPCPTPSQPPLPDRAKSVAAATRVLQAGGLDAAADRLRVDDGWGTRTISLTPQIDGLDTFGLESSVTVDADLDVAYANGWLSAPDAADRYPLLDPKAATERLMGGIFAMGRPSIACDALTPECTGGGTPQVREITAVRLGLMMAPPLSGNEKDAYLIPAWIYTIKGSDYPEIAVALTDEYLPKPPTPEPGTGTKPGVIEPGGPEPAPPPPNAVPPAEPATDTPATPPTR